MEKMRFAVRLLLVLCVTMIAQWVCADDSALSGISGGTIQPMVQHPLIRMVSEIVNVRMTNKTAHVRCEFVFRNEGKATTVSIGFPERAWSSGDGGAHLRLKGFRSSVDGTKANITYIQSKSNRKQDEGQPEYKAWYVKRVPFAQGQTRTVVDEYDSELGNAESIGAPVDVARFFTYVLKTGSSWKGPIGKATINVDTTGVPPFYDFEPSPKGSARKDGVITWVLTNFEPGEDIEVWLSPRCPKLNGKTVEGGWWNPYSVDNGIIMAGPYFIDQMGGLTDYNPQTHVLVIKYGSKTLKLSADSKIAMLNGSEQIKMPRALWYREGYNTCAIPVTAVVKALGGRTEYDRKALRLNVWLKDLSDGH